MTSFVYAQAASPGAMDYLNSLIVPTMMIIGIMYFMMIRPQQRKEKDRKKMIDDLKTGQRVVFSGGILGTVTNVKEGIFVVKIAENVKIEIARGAVNRVLGKDEKTTDEENGK